jgi:hypothetical protein
MVNIRNMQEGLMTGPDKDIFLSDYHESRIKHFHHALNSYLSDETT